MSVPIIYGMMKGVGGVVWWCIIEIYKIVGGFFFVCFSLRTVHNKTIRFVKLVNIDKDYINYVIMKCKKGTYVRTQQL